MSYDTITHHGKMGLVTYLNKVIPQMSKKNIKKLKYMMLEYDNSDTDCDNRVLNVMDDLIKYKFQKKTDMKQTKKKYTNPIKVLYINPAVEGINLNSILQNKEVKKTMPDVAEIQEISTVYKYTKSIRNKIHNYRETDTQLQRNCKQC